MSPLFRAAIVEAAIVSPLRQTSPRRAQMRPFPPGAARLTGYGARNPVQYLALVERERQNRMAMLRPMMPIKPLPAPRAYVFTYTDWAIQPVIGPPSRQSP